MPSTRARLRLAIVSPHPAVVSPTAAWTVELIRALHTAAPEIAVNVCAIGRATGPGAATPHVAATIDVDDPTAYRRAAHRLARLGADVVLVQYRPDAAAGPRARHLLGLCDELARVAVPYLALLHDVRRNPRPGDADIVAALCRHAAAVVVLSDPAAAVLLRRHVTAADRIAVVPPGAPADLWLGPVGEPASAALRGALAGAPVLSSIGPVRPAKGLRVAVSAMAGIARQHPGVRYVVAERYPDPVRHPYRQALREAVRALALDRAVHLLDGLTPRDQSVLLRSTTVYLAPDLDRDRTSSIGLTYALAAGCPVVASDTPAARALLAAGVGSLVPPGDPAALATAANRLLCDPARLAGARAAALRCGAELSFAATAEQIAGLVHLVARHAPRRAA